VFKKALRVATAFGVLLAGYAGYVHAFALLAKAIGQPTKTPPFGGHESRSVRQAIELAARAFGPTHWAADKGLQIRIYNAERGFWMYARDQARKGDGRRVEFTPFAAIVSSPDGRVVKTIVGESAVIDLDRPYESAMKPGADNGALKVVHARIEKDVFIRDDKGTPDDPADDLRIGPLTHLEYDGVGLRIFTADQDVPVEDASFRITGDVLSITLRAKDDLNPAAGFDGAKSLSFRRNVHIVMADAGPGGLLVGGNPAKPPARDAQAAPVNGARLRGAPEPPKNPLDLHAAGSFAESAPPALRVDLPPPVPPVLVGPPATQGPTFVEFDRNVEVVRGDPAKAPDHLDCDHLRLTLVPEDRAAVAAKAEAHKALAPADELDGDAAAAPPGGGPGGNLTLARAVASGHNVWLRSPGQGANVRCNELIHVKHLPDAPDETYFRGDPTNRMVVEKTDVAQDGPDKGKVTSYTRITTLEAKVFDDGRGNDYAKIVARGKGDLESRPGIDKAVTHTANWSDSLTIKPEEGPAPAGRPGGPARMAYKKITLEAGPDGSVADRVGFTDVAAKTSLDARKTIVVWLRPKTPELEPKPNAKAGTPAGDMVDKGTTPGGAFEIEKLLALDDVHLKSPTQTLIGRTRLDATFESRPALLDLETRQAAAETRPAQANPEVEANAEASDRPATAPAAAGAAPATTPPLTPVPRPDPQAKAVADRVWAKILLRPGGKNAAKPEAGADAQAGKPAGLAGMGGGQRAEIDEVFLLGGVRFHQDPAPGKAKGTDVAGESVYLLNQGDDRMRFQVYNYDPKAAAPGSNPEKNDRTPLARVETDEMTIAGKMIALDQAANQAWVTGRGSLARLTAQGLLTDKAVTGPAEVKGGDKAKNQAKATTPAGPTPAPVKMSLMTISFGKGMHFYGTAEDPIGRPAARAEFFENVRAVTDEATIDCSEKMIVFLDQTVKLVRPKPAVKGPAAGDDGEPKPEGPKPDVALVECFRDVVVVNHKLDPKTKALLQKQRIEGDYLVFEKGPGKFRVPGEGVVYLYEREAVDAVAEAGVVAPGPGLAPAGSRRRITPTAGPGLGQDRGVPVVGRTTTRGPGDATRLNGQAQLKGKEKGKGAAPPPPPLVLTQVRFNREMTGRFGSGTKESEQTEPRWADFFGDVEAVRGRVANANSVIDPDSLPADGKFMTAQVLRVVSEPNPSKPDDPPRYLMRAWENAVARTPDSTIQADTLTYDSAKDLFYAYGENGHYVLLAQQGQAGQPATVVPGRTVMYNLKTGASQIIDPQSAKLIDAKTGFRPQPSKPKDDFIKPRLPNRQRFKNNPGSIERKGFNSR